MSNPFFRPLPEELRDCPGNWLFCDGGVIITNPSPDGGTWAWVRVKDGVVVAEGAGVLTAERVGAPVSNNVSELYALCKGLEALPRGWSGTVCSDSKVTLIRAIYPSAKMNGVPEAMARWARRLCDRWAPRCFFTLLDGHPTREHLAAGAGKRGQPVSKWNVWCDEECGRQSRLYREKVITG